MMVWSSEVWAEMGYESKKKEDKNNPWAICNAQGLKGDKLERCIMDVKKKTGYKE